ncbi:MAG TPA: oligopeptide/dipeptide ABC transporter ATP-binding protein [Microvirga sp.]|jgi:peptide/nickel transport system ATP-binding protein/oligopeptide transport system ATP-binding protein|nr:oligopeptide/dipeptide ABC transporter ATP-binding protein [Microvirga sp.]
MSALLEIRDLSKVYPAPGGAGVRALNRVSLTLHRGEVLGIVGESGCGKSTLGRALLRLIEPTSGQVLFEGEDITALDRAALKRRRRDLQIVFQDPFGSLNPRHRVGAIIREPLDVHRIGSSPERAARVRELLTIVGLPEDAAGRYPHEFSGGQRQRIAIARALALEPKLIVADEPVSALDVSIQSQIINLIADLRRRLGLSILFISHDLSVIRHVSDRIAVMYLGSIVETGPAGTVMETPTHPYTQALLSAIPRPDAAGRRERIVLKGELPDPAHPPSGCAFHTRCPFAMPVCTADPPALVPRRHDGRIREAACHLYEPAGAETPHAA